MAKRTQSLPTAKAEANKYDKILKENITSLVPAFLSKILKIKAIRLENLPETRVQATTEAEPDFVRKAYTDQHPKGFILQIDFETADSSKVDPKILKHIALQHEKYALPVDVHLIYLRRGRPKYIKGGVRFFGIDVVYPVYALSEISYKEFIHSEMPEEVLLSILADPEGERPETIITMILERLVRLQNEAKPLRKFINQLKVLSLLRNLQPEVQKQIKHMPLVTAEIIKQIREDENFLIGLEEGMEKGLEKGLEKGQLKQAIIGVRSMTKRGFEASVIADLLGLKSTEVESLQKQLLQESAIVALLQQKKSVAQIAKALGVEPMLVEVVADVLGH